MKYLLSLLLLPTVFRCIAQEPITLNTAHRCIYSGVLETELYSFEPNASVPAMVDNILRATGTPQNFTLIEANVENVVALLDGDKRYILYSQDFFLKTKGKAIAYGLLAHEIGHHAAGHTFDDTFREKEELEADLFAGYALCKTPDVNYSDAMALPDYLPLSYPVSKDQRVAALSSGWRRADAYLRGKENLGYYEDKTANDGLPLPRFPWPPPQCAQRRTLVSRLSQSCSNLADTDLRLRRALDAKGYTQRSYFQTPGGFAIVTQLEQFNTDGSSKMGQNRWADYPVQDDFSGLWSYLQALVMPNPGHFRIFVFIVTDTPYNQSNTQVSKEQAVAWLSQGLNILPVDIGKMPVTGKHYLDVLVYEFEAPQSTKRCTQKCPCLKDIGDHLQKSGLGGMLKIQKLVSE